VWLTTGDADAELVRAVGTRAVAAGVQVEQLHGSYDPPGARLLDVVAVMDRLRSPGGCPWDAEQTHTSLMPYLLEEAYEAYQALEDGDPTDLREELGDVLLQVAFHARLARRASSRGRSTTSPATWWTSSCRRHPHVFAGGSATTSRAAGSRSRRPRRAARR
jgi:XTP/dITP diphosphohydrolase